MNKKLKKKLVKPTKEYVVYSYNIYDQSWEPEQACPEKRYGQQLLRAYREDQENLYCLVKETVNREFVE